MKLLFGLGNPGARYDGTRHNVGFWLLDRYVAELGASFQDKPKFKALVAQHDGEHKLLLAKPSTYYNEVGDSLQALMQFYKLTPDDVLVLHDDLALPFGTIRTRIGGSGGGSNGIKSLNARGGETTHRLRVGIRNDQLRVMGDTAFVLAKFSSDERAALESSLYETARQVIEAFIADAHQPTTHSLPTD